MSWYNEKGDMQETVLSTRARLARNIVGMRFPFSMSDDEALKVIEKVDEAIRPIADSFIRYDMTKMTEKDALVFVEKHLISPNFKAENIPRVCYISKDEDMSIMVNEEDHIRIQSFAAGYNPSEVLEKCGRLDDLLKETIEYAFHEKYGYLTSCPTNCGTALRISAMMHLPAIVLSGGDGQLIRECAKNGMTVRGIYGEGSKAAGNIYQISNQITLGLTINELEDRFKQVTMMASDAERELRDSIAKKPSDQLIDKIYRSYGILKNAYTLTSKEFTELQSMVRLGVYMGMLNSDLTEITRLSVETSPAFLGSLKPSDRDRKRAEEVKKAI